MVEVDDCGDDDYRVYSIQGRRIVEAQPIRRKRHLLVVAGLMLLLAGAVVVFALGVPLGLQNSGPFAASSSAGLPWRC